VTVSAVARKASISDHPALEALFRRACLANPGDREAILAHPELLVLPVDQIEDGRVFIAERKGVILGFASIADGPAGGTELDGLFVDPSQWRQGVGRMLVNHCAEVAQARGSSELHVVGNYHAEGFYLSCGFEKIGAAETRFGSALLLRRPL